MVLILKHTKEIQISRQDQLQTAIRNPIRKFSDAPSNTNLPPLIEAHKNYSQDPLN